MTEEIKDKTYFRLKEEYLSELQRLKQENAELKEENIKVKKEFNNLIAEIISDIEYTGEITCNGESPKEHLKKCQKALKALEEIREKAQHCIRQDACALCDYSKECAVPDEDGLVYDNNRLLIDKINEILTP